MELFLTILLSSILGITVGAFVAGKLIFYFIRKDLNKPTHWFKGKPYRIYSESKIKLNDEWVPCIVYTTCYDNPDGEVWVRLEQDFDQRFKPYYTAN